jgi:hypothetical protein
MPAYEDEFVYGMMVRDVLCILPDGVREYADTLKWGADLNDKAKHGMNYGRTTPRVIQQLSPALEEGLLSPMFKDKDPTRHQFNLSVRKGQLVNLVVEDTLNCKRNLSSFVKSTGGGWELAMLSLGSMCHRLIDVWNPFALGSGPQNDQVGALFMQSLKVYHEDLPFFWAHVDDPNGMTEFLNNSPYTDPMATTIEAERRFEMYYKGIGNRYLCGNGFPAAKELVGQWYNAALNAIGRTIWFCAS